VILDLSNPFFTDLARGVDERANEAGYSVIVCNSDEDAAKEDGRRHRGHGRGAGHGLIRPEGSRPILSGEGKYPVGRLRQHGASRARGRRPPTGGETFD
jgi:hypothetical protein